MLTLVLVVCVLARPQTTTPQSERETQGINIMMCMDISVSMLTRDLEPNRIEAAKQVAVEFIAGRENDNIGLTLFGGEAFTQCPLTTDHAALLSMFKQVNCNLQQQGIISDGTAIGMGLTNAVSRLSQLKAPSKVIILLTDGANNSGDISPLMAAEIAKKQGIRVYTIAVGRQGKVQQPVAILPNGEYYYQTVESDADPATLRQIAEMTGACSTPPTRRPSSEPSTTTSTNWRRRSSRSTTTTAATRPTCPSPWARSSASCWSCCCA